MRKFKQPAGFGKDPKAPYARPDPFADEKPLFSITAQNAAAVRRQARRHGGDLQDVSELPDGRLQDPPLGRVPEVRAGQHGQERHRLQGPGRRHPARRLLGRPAVSDPEERRAGHVESPRHLPRPRLGGLFQLLRRGRQRHVVERRRQPAVAGVTVLRPEGHIAGYWKDGVHANSHRFRCARPQGRREARDHRPAGHGGCRPPSLPVHSRGSAA